jgi:hypothetical protein
VATEPWEISYCPPGRRLFVTASQFMSLFVRKAVKAPNDHCAAARSGCRRCTGGKSSSREPILGFYALPLAAARGPDAVLACAANDVVYGHPARGMGVAYSCSGSEPGGT